MCFFADLASLWTAAEPEPDSSFTDAPGRDTAAEGAELFDEKKDPLAPGPGCSHRGIAYSAHARSAMTPRATSTLSAKVLIPLCVSRDILCTIGAHQPALPASLVIPDDNRRKNARQRAATAGNLSWMQKVGLLASNLSVGV
jgi:hypothetical protein